MTAPECEVVNVETWTIVCQSSDGITGNGLETFSEEEYDMFK